MLEWPQSRGKRLSLAWNGEDEDCLRVFCTILGAFCFSLVHICGGDADDEPARRSRFSSRRFSFLPGYY